MKAYYAVYKSNTDKNIIQSSHILGYPSTNFKDVIKLLKQCEKLNKNTAISVLCWEITSTDLDYILRMAIKTQACTMPGLLSREDKVYLYANVSFETIVDVVEAVDCIEDKKE